MNNARAYRSHDNGSCPCIQPCSGQKSQSAVVAHHDKDSDNEAWAIGCNAQERKSRQEFWVSKTKKLACNDGWHLVLWVEQD